MKKNALFIILIIGVALVIGVWRDQQKNEISTNTFNQLLLSAGMALQQPYPLPRFSLTDMHDHPFTNAALRSHWTFMFFGYSQCPHVCPATLGAMKQISDKLGKNANLQFVFVSIDPEHDTPQTLKAFLHQDNLIASILGITGDKAAILALAEQVGIHVAKEGDDAVNAAHVEHGGAILLINPEGKLTAIFTTTDKTNAIVRDFKEIVHHYMNA